MRSDSTLCLVSAWICKNPDLYPQLHQARIVIACKAVHTLLLVAAESALLRLESNMVPF